MNNKTVSIAAMFLVALSASALFLVVEIPQAEAHTSVSCSYVTVRCVNGAFFQGIDIGYWQWLLSRYGAGHFYAPSYGGCASIACHDSSSCQDGSVSTTDSCTNADTASSYCSYSSCPSGTVDKNDNVADGCEINLMTDPSNCGSVGNVCPSGACVSGMCNNFNMATDPASGVANKGDVKVVNATLTQVVGSSSAAFSATGAPAGTTVSFSPASCVPSCYSNATVTTTASTSTGAHTINILATAGSLVKSSTYSLTVLPDSCNNNLVCDYPETQSSCASDCSTTATMPSPVTPGEIVTVSVEFYDFRYLASDKVRIDLKLDGTVPWTSSNGCLFGGVKLGPAAGSNTVAWPSGTTSEAGHFKITTLCTVPSSLSAGAHMLVATPTIF
ncbi:MAG: hypothetical protein HY833_02980 [Candidatus Aenigmarchaeota archaeon]|nr:hypothetical protein [Candidatus Aenigmarchaeota archaeon]